ncbi:MAG: ABC transporter permease [Bacteroidota bacterium]
MKNRPPHWPDRFLEWFCDPELFEYIQGDIYEIFEERLQRKGSRYAKLAFCWDVFRFFRPSNFRKPTYNSNPNMTRHNFKIAGRALLKHKTYSFINMLGLSIGMAICLLLFQYIQFELSFDKFHQEANNIYRVKFDDYQNDVFFSSQVTSPLGLGPAIDEAIPEIKEVVRIRPMLNDEGVVISNMENAQSFLEFGLYYVDYSFFQLFDYQFIEGSSQSALKDLHSIVLTKESAIKYFGNTDVLGRTLSIKGGQLTAEFTVSGVLESLPPNTHLQFDFLLPAEFIIKHYGPYKRGNGWDWFNFYTYFSLTEGAEPASVIDKIDRIAANHLKPDDTWEIKSEIQALTAIHFTSDFSEDLAENTSNYQNIWFYGLIGLIIMLVAWLNFINLSTAQSIKREKEMGIRKCLGVQRKQLIAQLLTESLLINLLAGFIAIALAFMLLPIVNQILEVELALDVLLQPWFVFLFLGVLVISSMVAGMYPAFVMSSMKPISIARGNPISVSKGFDLRKVLVTLQFAISISLIAVTYVVYQQINFMKSQNLGYDIEQILIVPGPRVVIEEGRDLLPGKYKAFKSDLVNHHSIKSVTGTSNIPGKGAIFSAVMRKPQAEPGNTFADVVFVDAYFQDAYGMDLIAGDGFREEDREYSGVIINEQAVKTYQLGSANEAIGQQIIIEEFDTLMVKGVIKNLHWNSLHQSLRPNAFVIAQWNGYFSVRIQSADLRESLEHIESTFRTVFPNDPYESYFLDQAFEKQYNADVKFGKLFFVFTMIAIVMATIGLFVMVSFSVSFKIKEIGIRKVLGASVRNIMILLSREYFILLLVAGLIAIPVVWFGIRSFLDNYPYRITPGWDLILIPGLIASMIALVTVGYRTYLSANANPVDTLRKE